jgi:hypothetical protein
VARLFTLTDLQVTGLLSRWKHGETIPRLAKEVGVHPRTISRAFRKRGEKPKTGGKGGARPRHIRPEKEVDWKTAREWSRLLKPRMLGDVVETTEGKKIPTAAIAAWVPSVDPIDLSTTLQGRLKAGAGNFTITLPLQHLRLLLHSKGSPLEGQGLSQASTRTPTSDPPDSSNPTPSASLEVETHPE